MEKQEKQRGLENKLYITMHMINELLRMRRKGVDPEKAWEAIRGIDSSIADQLAETLLMLYDDTYFQRKFERHKDRIEELSKRAGYMEGEGFTPEQAWLDIYDRDPEAAATFTMLTFRNFRGVGN